MTAKTAIRKVAYYRRRLTHRHITFDERGKCVLVEVAIGIY